MSNSKHTPGPWKLGSTFNEDILVQSEYFKIARLCDDAERLTTDGKDATKANARLIAAAPELLEALKALQSIQYRRAGCPHKGCCVCKENEEIDAKVSAAIAKATGGANE